VCVVCMWAHIEVISRAQPVPSHAISISSAVYHCTHACTCRAARDDHTAEHPCHPQVPYYAPTNILLVNTIVSRTKKIIKVSLKWIAQQGIPVIPKTHKKEWLLENMDLFDWTLSDEDMATLTAATSPPVAGNAGPPPTSGDCTVA
jgi:hypothetical protein